MTNEYRLIRDVNYRSDNRNGYIGEGIHEVADEDVEEVEDSELWEAVEDDDGGDTSKDAGSDDADETDDGSEGEDEATEEDGGFDADTFVNDSGNWRSVVAAIEDGEVDDALDEVEQAERDRDSPRDSVLEAIEGRR